MRKYQRIIVTATYVYLTSGLWRIDTVDAGQARDIIRESDSVVIVGSAHNRPNFPGADPIEVDRWYPIPGDTFLVLDPDRENAVLAKKIE